MNPDKKIIEGCKKGDRRAMQELFDRYSRKMMALAYRYARTSFDTEDIVQEGFIRVFSNIHTYKYQGSFDGWIKRIFVNTAINHYRKFIVDDRNIQLEDSDRREFEAAETADNLNYEELRNLINQLPEGYRFVFNMFAIEGYSHKEIAEMLNITEGTSSTQYMRARKHLIRLLTVQQMV